MSTLGSKIISSYVDRPDNTVEEEYECVHVGEDGHLVSDLESDEGSRVRSMGKKGGGRKSVDKLFKLAELEFEQFLEMAEKEDDMIGNDSLGLSYNITILLKFVMSVVMLSGSVLNISHVFSIA